MPLTEALERDLKAYSADKDARPFRYSVGSFVESCGDLGVTHIERRHVTDWLAAQQRDGLSPATVKRRYGTIKAFVGRAMLDLGSDRLQDDRRRRHHEARPVQQGHAGADRRIPYLDSGRVGLEVVALVRIHAGDGRARPWPEVCRAAMT